MRLEAYARPADWLGAIVSFVIAMLAPAGMASAQSNEVITYYHTDAIGSVRMITDANGQVLERHDYLPFGEEWQAPGSTERRLYAGKERDPETGFDYSGARYYAPNSGRFTSPDPLTSDALRIVSPQRWNRYAYAANNPLTYGDPDGLDVIVFNYVNGALGAGHIGIMAVDPHTGAALYGGFNPERANHAWDTGKVTVVPFAPGSIRFENGRPTRDSLAQVEEHLIAAEHQGAKIRSAYFKTSDAETASLRRYIESTAVSRTNYFVLGNNCLVFTISGLRAAGIDAPVPTRGIDVAPNRYFTMTLSELEWRLGVRSLTPEVSTTYCIQTEKGCVP